MYHPGMPGYISVGQSGIILDPESSDRAATAIGPKRTNQQK